MAEILLVQPPLPKSISEYSSSIILSPPLGLGYIASNLISKGFEVEVIDMAALKLDEKKFESEFRRYDPEIIGITTSTLTYKNALKVAAIAKKLKPKVYTVIGGPHVTFLPEETLQNSQIDIVVRREGENTILELAHQILKGKKEFQSVKGISYRRGDKIIHNPERPLIEDLDSLPFPARQLFPLHLYKVPGTIITSRGCPFKCIFCSANAMSAGRYRVRSPENVIAEVEEIVNRFSIKGIFIADDTFTVFKERTRKICEALRKINLIWFCEARVNTVNREIIQEMTRAGCRTIQFGVESGSQRILASIRKGITIEQVKKAVKWTVEAGILPVCSFMVPHPEDTKETIRETKKFMEQLRDMGALVVISLTTPFPGTYLYTHAKDLGVTIISDNTDEYDMATPVITTKNLSLKEIEEAFDDLIAFCTAQEGFQAIYSWNT